VNKYIQQVVQIYAFLSDQNLYDSEIEHGAFLWISLDEIDDAFNFCIGWSVNIKICQEANLILVGIQNSQAIGSFPTFLITIMSFIRKKIQDLKKPAGRFFLSFFFKTGFLMESIFFWRSKSDAMHL
jgi:hypothetical protein